MPLLCKLNKNVDWLVCVCQVRPRVDVLFHLFLLYFFVFFIIIFHVHILKTVQSLICHEDFM